MRQASEEFLRRPPVDTQLGLFASAEPDCVTILPTYRCNAACRECCFESNSSIRHRMDRDELLALIRRIRAEFPHVRYVVLSGGEVTLLKDDLIDAIALLTQLGLGSRIVTNGYWGRTDESAQEWVERLVGAGLCELNLSTGDEHLEWVPIDSVARAAFHATKMGLLTLVVIEGKDTAKFRLDDLRAHPLVQEILASEESRQQFIMMTNIWMPFHADTDITGHRTEAKREGCDNIFENLVVNPYGYIMSCCGLTMEYIAEMKIGHIDRDRLRAVYAAQYADLLKLWIWLDGTRMLFDLALRRLGLDIKLVSPHPCSICAQIYQDPRLLSAIHQLVEENAEQIFFRATIKAQMNGRVLEVRSSAHEPPISV